LYIVKNSVFEIVLLIQLFSRKCFTLEESIFE
jgi:uncharacterized protein YlzI (FlbEa/FlbD family)